MSAVTVVCAIIEKNGKVLIAKRAANSSMPNKWELPGGKIQPDESPYAAIIREINEELGCTVNPVKTLKTNTHAYPDFDIDLTPIVCELSVGEPVALEHAEIRWVIASELNQFDWAAADIAIINDYVASKVGSTK